MSQGVYVLGGKCPGGKCPGGKCLGGICPWGKCPGGTCPGGGGRYALEPSIIMIMLDNIIFYGLSLLLLYDNV